MLKQRLQHKLLQKLSPQQIQLMKLLQVPTVELEQRIKEEIEENPALEEGAELEDAQNELEQDDKFDGDDSESRDSDEFDINDYLDDDIPAYKTHSNNSSSENDEKAIPLSGGKTFQNRSLSTNHVRMHLTRPTTILSHAGVRRKFYGGTTRSTHPTTRH